MVNRKWNNKPVKVTQSVITVNRSKERKLRESYYRNSKKLLKVLNKWTSNYETF